MANRDCNLECAKDKGQAGDDDVFEFVGPVKIVLVDIPSYKYYLKTCSAAIILLAQILIGVTTMTILFYSVLYPIEGLYMGLHIFLCTVGVIIYVMILLT